MYYFIKSSLNSQFYGKIYILPVPIWVLYIILCVLGITIRPNFLVLKIYGCGVRGDVIIDFCNIATVGIFFLFDDFTTSTGSFCGPLPLKEVVG